MKKLQYYQVATTLVLNLFIFSNVCASEKPEDLAREKLVASAKSFMTGKLNNDPISQITVEVMPIDARINIPACSSDFVFSVNEDALSQSNISLKAECETNNWYMFLVVKSTEIQPVVVLSSAVSPGTLLTKDNVHVINMDKKRLRSTTYADINDVVGARMKRRIAAGRPVDPSNLCYVCKGDSVTISANTSVMQVKTSGIALEDGSMGETISVRNSRSKKRIQAIVSSTGQVEINI